MEAIENFRHKNVFWKNRIYAPIGRQTLQKIVRIVKKPNKTVLHLM